MTTNLRSRGDGPLMTTPAIALANKPPLTRRWTRRRVFHPASRFQTSAHAEMDLEPVFVRRHVLPNLRSRGDGPVPIMFRIASLCKPPLTRRWTILPCLMLNTFSQTSAHAGMNLKCTTLTVGEYAKPRSRGDGPFENHTIMVEILKPPLTRRWTCVRCVHTVCRCQTSAHAEMDPRWARRSPARWPNLRSRGDGPTR